MSRTTPYGKCDDCGEPKRIEGECPNCRQLDRMEAADAA